jgi:glutaredoxin-like protein
MLIQEKIEKEIRKQFEGLKEKVKLVVFTQEFECQYCRETRLLAEETAKLSDKVSVEVFNFTLDKEKVQEYKIDKIPALAVVGEKDYGIRFYGFPGGYEFTSFLEAIQMVSIRESGLTAAGKDTLKKLAKPVHIQVFVTPT